MFHEKKKYEGYYRQNEKKLRNEHIHTNNCPIRGGVRDGIVSRVDGIPKEIRSVTQCVNSRANEPHGIQYIAVLGDPQQFVRHGDRVHVAVLAVVEVSIGTPDPLEHFDAETERLDRAQEAQARVAPRLPEVTVHRVILGRRDFQTRFSPDSRSSSTFRTCTGRLGKVLT